MQIINYYDDYMIISLYEYDRIDLNKKTVLCNE